jgi:hypothetical protein
MAMANPQGPAYAQASGAGAAVLAPLPGSGQLTYHGGPVMAGTAHVYLIFWEPPGHGVTPSYNQLIERYFQDVNDTGLYENNEQYKDASGQYPADEALAGTCIPIQRTR